MTRPLWFLSAVVLAVAQLAGCTSGDSELASHRARYLLDHEPPDALGVLLLRDSLKDSAEVTLVGMIGGVADPWTRGQAAFVVSDPSALADHGDEHHCAEDCPFCSKHAAENEAIALVQFVDARGRVLPIDARKLFGLAEKQMVVVRGQAQVDELGYLVVRADGLYIRR